MDASIGIIGGSGLYSLLDDADKVKVKTKYGNPSDTIAIGTLAGVKVAFLPRHGSRHTIPPHKVPYRANIDAMAQLGVTRIIATNAVGSLRPDYKPGELAAFDQFVNLTNGRADTFFDEDVVVHVSSADPYCPDLRKLAVSVAKREKIAMHDSGTVAVISGPRFSSRAESRTLSSNGYHMVNMTQYPEVILARERRMCYLGIGLVTDYDVGLEGRADIHAVTAAEVSKIFGENVEKAKRIITGVVASNPADRKCQCSASLDGAVQTPGATVK